MPKAFFGATRDDGDASRFRRDEHPWYMMTFRGKLS